MEALPFVLQEPLLRCYKRNEQGHTVPVPVKEVMYLPKRLDWFYIPSRDPYIKLLQELFGPVETNYELANLYTNLTYDQFLLRLINENNAFANECPVFWTWIHQYFKAMRLKVYKKLEETGIVYNINEIDEIRLYWGERIGNGVIPDIKRLSLEEQESLIAFLIIHIVMCNNLQDVFGAYMVQYWEFLERPYCINPFINHGLIVPKEIAQRVLHVVSSPELYIMCDRPDLFGISKDEENYMEFHRILYTLEENYSPGVDILNRRFKGELMSKSYILDMLTQSNTVNNNQGQTIQRAFILMRKGIGDRVIQEFKIDYANPSKSFVRRYIEEVLTKWWEMYINKECLSIPIAASRIREFVNSNTYKIKIDSNTLISPYKQRLIILNEGETRENFTIAVRDLISKLHHRAHISDGGMNFNKYYIESDLVKIVDILVHP